MAIGSCHDANFIVTRYIAGCRYNTSGPFHQHGLTLIPAWISNYIHYKVWDEITYPFLNFNGATVEGYERVRNYVPITCAVKLNHEKWAKCDCCLGHPDINNPLLLNRKFGSKKHNLPKFLSCLGLLILYCVSTCSGNILGRLTLFFYFLYFLFIYFLPTSFFKAHRPAYLETTMIFFPVGLNSFILYCMTAIVYMISNHV